jgi:predicted DNA-binding protein (MmcQ/YjbR family)
MNLETLREYCLGLPGVTEDLPFGPDTLAFKVKGKVFLLTSLDSPTFGFNAKCDPEKAEELRQKYPDVKPGYHMNKKHWNTVDVTGSIPGTELFEMVKNSYELVIAGLPKKDRDLLSQ